VIFDLSQRDETSPFHLNLTSRNQECLGVAVNGSLGILQENVLPPPFLKEGCCPGVRGIARPVCGIPLAENNSNQVIGAGLVITILHRRTDLVVRLGGYVRQNNAGGIVSEGSKRLYVCHLGTKWKLYQAGVPGNGRAKMRSTIPRMDKLLHRPRIKAAQDPAADKVLTLCLRTCDNITRQIEDSMARQSGRGSSRPRHLIRKIALASRSFSSPRLGILALLLVLASVPLNAQTPDVEDIHIAPRVETDKDKANAENALLNDTVR